MPGKRVIVDSLEILAEEIERVRGAQRRFAEYTQEQTDLIFRAAVEAGAPEGIIGWIDSSSLEMTNTLMREADIILATGGPGMVKSAYSSGKPALGVGPGNVPAVIDETADIKLAANSIIHSKIFDNGMICASEQSVIVLDAAYAEAGQEFEDRGCWFLNHGDMRSILSCQGSKMIFSEQKSDGFSFKPAAFLF
jgi:acetaldehyde dehydrogenase/alcohol dehydrogenase